VFDAIGFCGFPFVGLRILKFEFGMELEVFENLLKKSDNHIDVSNSKLEKVVALETTGTIERTLKMRFFFILHISFSSFIVLLRRDHLFSHSQRVVGLFLSSAPQDS
jgi:hypothetical protein